VSDPQAGRRRQGAAPRTDDKAPPAPLAPRDAARRQKAAHRRRVIIEYVVIAAAAVGIALLVQAFLVKPYRIPSESMLDTLRPGDRVFVNRFIYHFRDVHRGDIVVFKAPGSGLVLIKRVIGLPGETIALRDGRVYVNGRALDEPYVRRVGGRAEPTEAFPTGTAWALAQPYTVPSGCFFMMGDNRTDSGDSREFGPVPHDRIIGEAFFIYWPLNRIRIL
jgi:signal peptidase I